MNINTILKKLDNIVIYLRERFLSLKLLLAEYNGINNFSIIVTFK